MKFEVGDKVVFEVASVDNYRNVKMMSSNRSAIIGFDAREANNLDKLDMTAEEAWGLARRIVMSEMDGGLLPSEMREIFGIDKVGRILKNNTPQEARDKIRAWEESKEIKVGDVVKVAWSIEPFVVTKTGDYWTYGIGMDGAQHSWITNECIKTGKHIDIQSILDQIGGGEE